VVLSGSICNGHPASELLIIKKLQNPNTLQNVSFHSDRYLITRRSQVQILLPLPIKTKAYDKNLQTGFARL